MSQLTAPRQQSKIIGRESMSKILSVVSILYFLSACSTVSSSKNFSEAQRENASSAQAVTTEERTIKLYEAVEKDYDNAVTSCSKSMGDVRKEFTGQRTASVGIATVGIVAGSIVVPALAAKTAVSKAAIAGWGGVSGAANAGQYMLDSNGLSPFQTAEVYEQMRKEVRDAMNSYSSGDTPAKKAAAVNAMVIACQFQPLPTVKPISPVGTLGGNGEKQGGEMLGSGT